MVNGARLSAEMLPTEGEAKFALSAMVYFAAGETETGPYKCLFSAWGQNGVHRSMTIHSLLVRTASGREQPVPAKGRIAFAPSTNNDSVNATYVFPGLLTLDFKKDGEVFLDADVTIQTKKSSLRRKVSLLLSPSPEKELQFHSIFQKKKEE